LSVKHRGITRYYGAKSGLIDTILSLMPKHHTFLDLFGGAGSVTLSVPTVQRNIYNDLHSGLYTLFKVIRDKDLFEEFQRLIAMTPCSREDQKYCSKHWQEEPSEVEKARQYYVAMQQGYGGIERSGFPTANGHKKAKQLAVVQRWLFGNQQLVHIHKCLQHVMVENLPWEECLARHDGEGVLCYCDPPYISETREKGSRKAYLHEMSIKDHERLVECILAAKSYVLLSGYRHEVYKPLEDAGWQTKDVPYNTPIAYAGQKERLETFWLNYSPLQKGLFDGNKG